MNYISRSIIEVIVDVVVEDFNGDSDTCFILAERKRFKPLNKHKALCEIYKFDDDIRNRIARKLNVDVNKLTSVSKFCAINL